MPETGVGDGGIAAAERRRASGGDVGDAAQLPETDNGVDHAAAAQRHLVFAERQIVRADDAERMPDVIAGLAVIQVEITQRVGSEAHALVMTLGPLVSGLSAMKIVMVALATKRRQGRPNLARDGRASPATPRKIDDTSAPPSAKSLRPRSAPLHPRRKSPAPRQISKAGS